jgi:preprotein translocase subunit YajC
MTLVELLPFAAIAAAFWLLIIRPSSVRRKAQAALVASLAPGQRIMTTAGVFGTVDALDGDRVSVEVAPGVVIEMLAVAIAQVVPADRDGDESADSAELAAEDRSDGAPEGEPIPPGDAPIPPAEDSPAPPALTQEADRG